MRIHLFVGIVVIACCLGCGSGIDFPLAPVAGTVLCEGKPVAGAAVYFEPLKSGETALVGPQSFSFTDKDGKFQLTVNGNVPGAVVGRNRVRVGGSGVKCNCSLNEEVDLTEVEVKKNEKNDFELVLKKKTRKELPNLADDDSKDIQ